MTTMDRLEGRLHRLAGRAQERAGQLGGDERARLAGLREQLLGMAQQWWGASRDEADRRLGRWVDEAEDLAAAPGRRWAALPGPMRRNPLATGLVAAAALAAIAGLAVWMTRGDTAWSARRAMGDLRGGVRPVRAADPDDIEAESGAPD